MINLYVPTNSIGSLPSLVSRKNLDPEIEDRLKIIVGDSWPEQDPTEQRVICTNIYDNISSELIKNYTEQFDRVLVHVGEPPGHFTKLFPVLDHPRTHLLVTGAVNYDFQHSRLHRIETFFGEMRSLYRHLPGELRSAAAEPKQFYFDAMLGTLSRLPRSWIRDHLEKQHPGKNIIRFYPPRTPYLFRHLEQEDYLWPEGVDWTGKEDEQFYAAQMVTYKGLPAMICLIIPWNIYDQTAYSIVTETLTDNGFNFYTEKTAKPIMARRLFVAFAGQYHLRNLRQLGFRTFDGIIDESYDLEADPAIRWKKALDQVDYLCAQDQSRVLAQIKDIVDHNFEVMQATDWVGQANDLIIDLALGEK